MAILFDSENRIFKLDTATSSYLIEIFEENYLLHLYYGAKIPDTNLNALRSRSTYASFSAGNENIPFCDFSADTWPMEYGCNGCGDFRISALQIKDKTGCNSTDIRYVSHEIINGKPALPGLPCLYTNCDCEAQTLVIKTLDKVSGAEVTLYYTVFENLGAMTRWAVIKNTSDTAMDIERSMSLCLDLPEMNYDLISLYGRHNKERTVERRALAHGLQGVASKRGSSSHQQNPFIALCENTATEDSGNAYGFNLVYSCNFLAEAEVDSNCGTRVIMGINPSSFGWHLEAGEEFCTPEAVMVFSEEGLGGMSRTFHKLYNKHLIRGEWKEKKRPLLINSWEAAYFSFDDDKLVAFAEKAKELGIEMLVMDDGWFGKRNDDHSSLGDWYVNTDKLKGGLDSLVKRVNALGLKFGIWYEPEMISPDSDLYRAHPDWCIHVAGRERSIGRQQYVIDFSRKDVRDAIYKQMYDVLSSTKIDYLKWDFNRNITEAGSALLPAERQKEFFHRFVMGTYEIMDRLTRDFPEMLLENCSGGGGRFDPGMLYYSPQIWTSDNTDPIERLSIQFGTSLCYPASTMGAHVSACRRTGYDTKGAVALWGTFGYELDPTKLSAEDAFRVKRQIAEYHEYYDLIRWGDLYRIKTPEEDGFDCAWEFVSEDKSEALLTVIVMRRDAMKNHIVRFKGLDPEKIYECDIDGEEYHGQTLMKAGINFSQQHWNDHEVIRIHVKEVK
ncbi:MAG: alpha-galactosidase [Clostridia bacterium]|nr:alpha-galactosidase [Clostridia bacterium]